MATKSPSESPKKRKVSQRSLANLKPPFGGKDDAWSEECRKKSYESKERLAEMRRRDRQELAEQQPEDSAKDFWRAVKSGDIKKVQCYEIAFKIKGSTFDQSEERVQNFKVNSDVNEKRNVVINFRQATPEDAK